MNGVERRLTSSEAYHANNTLFMGISQVNGTVGGTRRAASVVAVVVAAHVGPTARHSACLTSGGGKAGAAGAASRIGIGSAKPLSCSTPCAI